MSSVVHSLQQVPFTYSKFIVDMTASSKSLILSLSCCAIRRRPVCHTGHVILLGLVVSNAANPPVLHDCAQHAFPKVQLQATENLRK
jgi:hypothetical protein